MTCDTAGMCRPRAATSVAISTGSLPSLKSCSRRSRLFCGTSPEITAASKPLAFSVISTCSQSRLVLTKISVRSGAWWRSRPTSIGSFWSLATCAMLWRTLSAVTCSGFTSTLRGLFMCS
jgi:hypothetical protein